MRRVSGLIIIGIASVLTVQSCIFQTDPVRPNSPPVIRDAFPEELKLDIEVPTDSIRFSLTADDPDRDELNYSYVLLSRDGEILAMLHDGPVYVFEPEEGDSLYHLQGRVRDHSDYATRDWYVNTTELHNEPPVIISHQPNLDSLTVLRGDLLTFRLGVEDDHPSDLRYSFHIDGIPFEAMIENNFAQYQFMENGRFDITGLVWDGEYGDTLSWMIRVVEEPDTVPPARITDLIGWPGPEPGTIHLQWTAPGDDGLEGRANNYRVGTHTVPILNEDDWIEASMKNGAPTPGMPGTREEMIVVNLNPGTWLFVTVRAVDDFGNMSQLGNCIRLIVRGIDVDGYISDAATGGAIEGIIVSSEGLADTTGADGYYLLENLPLYTNLIRVKDETITGYEGEYYDIVMPLTGVTWHFRKDIAMMPFFEMVSQQKDTYESFYSFFRYMTNTRGLLGRPTIFRNWHQYPVTVYNPPFTWNDVDIQGIASTAMTVWNDLTERTLFVETSDPGEADVEIIYDTEVYMNHHVEWVVLNEDLTPAKMAIRIYPINTTAPIDIRGRRIFAHELGHILQMGHSDDLGHLMVGETSPIIDDPSQDEINLANSLVGLPAIFDATWYLDE